MSRLPALSLRGSDEESARDFFDPDGDLSAFDGVILRRIVGYFVDVMLIALLTGLIVSSFWVLGVLTLGLLSPFLALIVLIVPWGYHTLFIGGSAAATPGMRLFGLEVRRLDGGRPGYLLAGLLTAIFYVTVTFTSSLVLLVALFNPRGRTLHDILCGTVVVRSDALVPLIEVRTGPTERL